MVILAFGQNLPKRPNPPKLVNDLAGKLAPEQVAALERKLNAFDLQTSNQIAVLLVRTLNGLEPVDYCVQVGRDWGIGNKEFNNGVIILISTGEEENNRRKVFIAPGNGLEGALPDLTCKAISDSRLVPNLKQGNFYRGIDEAIDDIISATKGEYQAPHGWDKRRKSDNGFIRTMVMIFVIFIILVIISRRGGGKGGMMSRRGYSPWEGPIWIGGGGGSSGGGGGGGGGGGFGGFGGGSFGGGGAGSDW